MILNVDMKPTDGRRHGKVLKVQQGFRRFHPNPCQVKKMTEMFEHSRCPSTEELRGMAAEWDVPLVQLVVWFKNRRARFKPHTEGKGGEKEGATTSRKAMMTRTTMEAINKPSDILVRTAGTVVHKRKRSDGRVRGSDGEVRTRQPRMMVDDERSTQERREGMRVVGKGSEELRLCDEGRVGLRLDGRTPVPEEEERVEEVDEELPMGNEMIRVGKRSSHPCSEWDPDVSFEHALAFVREWGLKDGKHMQLMEQVCNRFFLDELQSGFTISSKMQPLEDSLRVLNEIMVDSSFDALPSGARTIMREFLCQLRSGKVIEWSPRTR
uniref:Homeobox domain-containing protein n=1 Tax=Compsopogon caeruleus TaxID=31354 RepID=A0A7S1TAZ9_9RHOD|mmetsp:Transcript_14264/g.29193  ORF Transcript_14264/g.29193 Transcript_14264/m.29193 type:complete len:324 (+) Transcript_14264:156-1127(+)